MKRCLVQEPSVRQVTPSETFSVTPNTKSWRPNGTRRVDDLVGVPRFPLVQWRWGGRRQQQRKFRRIHLKIHTWNVGTGPISCWSLRRRRTSFSTRPPLGSERTKDKCLRVIRPLVHQLRSQLAYLCVHRKKRVSDVLQSSTFVTSDLKSVGPYLPLQSLKRNKRWILRLLLYLKSLVDRS